MANYGKYKRLYFWAGTFLVGVFAALLAIGVQITSDGDKTCAGTFEDPCMSYITIKNPTAKNIYIYNKDNINFDFSPNIKDYAFFTKDGRCSATGSCVCELNDGSKYGVKGWRCTDFTDATKPRKDRLYVFMWQRYSTREHLLVGFKNNPKDDIKWTLGVPGDELDPSWFGQTPDVDNLEDSSVLENLPDNNYGTNDDLWFGEISESNRAWSYLKFNLSQIPTINIIDSANLCLYMYENNYDTGEQVISWVYGVSNQSWKETEITWNIKPLVDGGLLYTNDSFDGDDENVWICYDVTSWVQNQYSLNQQNISFLVNATLDYTADFFKSYSKEDVSSNKPYLNITYTDAPLLTLDGVTSDRKYEYGTQVNITVKSGGASDVLCIDFNAPNYNNSKDICGNKSIELIYNVSTYIQKTFDSTMNGNQKKNVSFVDEPAEFITNFDIAAIGIGTPEGIAYQPNNDTLWIVDIVDTFVYHLNSSGTNLSDGFNIGDIGSANPQGITFDNSTGIDTLWIADDHDDFAYHIGVNGTNLSDGISLKTGLGSFITVQDIVFDSSDNTLWYYHSFLATDILLHSYLNGTNATGAFDPTVISGVSITEAIAFDTRDNSFWFADWTSFFNYHTTNTGVNLTGGFLLSNYFSSNYIKGSVYDSTDSSLWFVDSIDDEVYHLDLLTPFSDSENIEFEPEINLLNATINLTCFENETTNTFPKDLSLDVADDGSVDIFFPGLFNYTTLQQDHFNSEGNQFNLTFTKDVKSIIYINYTSMENGVYFDNITFNITGFATNPVGIDITEYFYNLTNITIKETDDGHFESGNSSGDVPATYDDFSDGLITGRWTTSGSGMSTSWSVNTDNPYAPYATHSTSEIGTGSTACAGSPNPGSCSSGGSNTGTGTIYTSDFDFDTIKAITLNVSWTYSAGYPAWCCDNYGIGGQGTVNMGLRDDTGTTHTIGPGGSCSYDTTCGLCNGDSCSGSGTYDIVEYVRDSDAGTITSYVDGVYKNDFNYDIDKEYSLYFYCYAEGHNYNTGYGNGGTGSCSQNIHTITYSIAGGNYTDRNMTWGPGFIDSKELLITNPVNENMSSVTIDVTESNELNSGDCDILYYVSANNGTNWTNILPDTFTLFNTEGNSLRYRLNITGTDDENFCGVKDINLIVTTGFTENLTIDIGNDDIDEYNMTFEVNTANTPHTVTILNTDENITDCVQTGSCSRDDSTMLVPIAITSEANGIVGIDELVANTEINPIDINLTTINDILKTKTDNTNITFLFQSNQSGICQIDGLNFEYIGEKNYTAFGYEEDNRSNNDTRIISVRYSNFNVTYPYGIKSYNVFPSSLTAKNVTPEGQTLRRCLDGTAYCDNRSTGIFNITSLAKQDEFIIQNYINITDSTFFDIINITASNTTDKNQGILLNHTSQEIAILGNKTSSNNQTDIWHWLDFEISTLVDIVYEPQFCFRSYCLDCVQTDYWTGDALCLL